MRLYQASEREGARSVPGLDSQWLSGRAEAENRGALASQKGVEDCDQ